MWPSRRRPGPGVIAQRLLGPLSASGAERAPPRPSSFPTHAGAGMAAQEAVRLGLKRSGWA